MTSSTTVAKNATYRFGQRLAATADRSAEFIEDISAVVSQPKYLFVLDALGEGPGPADILVTLGTRYSQTPLLRCAVNNLPSFLGRDTAVMVIPGSSDSSSLMSGIGEVVQRGAQLIIVAGQEDAPALMEADVGSPAVCRVDSVDDWGLPGAVEYLSTGLVVMDAIGKSNASKSLRIASQELASAVEALGVSGGPADALAGRLRGLVPVFVGGGPIGETVGRMWNACFTRASGAASFASSLDEALLLAATVMESEHPIQADRSGREESSGYFFILLCQDGDDRRDQRKLKKFSALLRDHNIPHLFVEQTTIDPVARLFESLALGQLVSLRGRTHRQRA